ncbi:MAG: PGF-pre-PGF domain-containing protein [archaeon]
MNKRGIKRGILFLFVLLIVLGAVYVIAEYQTQGVQSVDVISPGNNIYISGLNGSGQNFTCNVTWAGVTATDGIVNLTFWHNFNGTFMVNVSNSTAVVSSTGFIFNASLPEGNFTWMCAAANKTNVTAGSNYVNSSIYTISVDYTSPNITVTLPANNTLYTNNNNQNFQIRASDARTSNVSMSCWYRYTDGINWSNNISVPCDVNTLFPAVNNESTNLSIWFYANDSLGNANGSQSFRRVKFGRNSAAPVVTLNSPVNGYNFTNTTNNYLTFNCSASDASGLYSLTFMSNATRGTSWGGNFTESLVADDPYGVDAITFETNISNMADGTYIWNCLAADIDINTTKATTSNSTYATNYTFTVDTMAPAVNEVLLSDYYVQNVTQVTIYVNVNDSGTGIHNVTAEGTLLTRVDDNNYTGTITLANVSSAYTVDVNASDYMGYVVNYVGQSFIIDDVAPNFVSFINRTANFGNLSVNVSYKMNISMNFSETMDINSFNTATVRLFDTNVTGATRLDGHFYYNVSNASEIANNGSIIDYISANTTGFLEMNPYRNLVPGVTYTLLLTGMTDNASNALAQAVYYYFKVKEDCDENGTLDAIDPDDDNDGVMDTSDFLTGNITNVATNVKLNMSVDWNISSVNVTSLTGAASIVRFYNGSNVSLASDVANGSGTYNHSAYIIEFNYTFGPTKEIDLRNVSIYWHNRTSYGMVWTYGLYPEANATTIYIYNSTNYSNNKNVAGICLKDGSYESPYNFSSNCTASDELYLRCPGENVGSSQFTAHKYNCSSHIFNNQQFFKVTGFDGDVLARQMDDTAYPRIVEISATADASNTANWTLLVKTDETATCFWSTTDVAIASMTRFLGNGLNHSYSQVFTGEIAGTWYVRCNDTENNIMTTSNSTTYSYVTTAAAAGSSSTSSTGGNGVDVVVSSATTLSRIIAGESAVVTFTDKALIVSGISLTTNTDVENVRVSVTKEIERQSDVNKDAPGDLYYYITVTKTGLEDSEIDEAKVTFHVTREWLADNNHKSSDIILYRYDNGVWNELKTKKLYQDDDDVYFEATSDALSYFAIVAKVAAAPTTEPEAETEPELIAEEPIIEAGMAWWWWVVIGLGIAIVAAAVVIPLVLKKKK